MKTKEKFEFFFLCFFAYSVLGWCYEVLLEVVVYQWDFSNRGFLFGPYCPVYGFGALLLILFLSWLQQKEIKWGRLNLISLVVFLGILIITTSLELCTSYLLEIITGGWLWDYSLYSFNFQGRIALNPSLRFGAGGMLFLYVLQPLFKKCNEKIGASVRKSLFILSGGVMALDFFLKVF